MKAMLLAAGRGERMRPLTDEWPKPLLKVGGKALIVHLVEGLVTAGYKDLVINLAYRGEQIESVLGDGTRYRARIGYSREDEALETGGGIYRALPMLGAGPFLVVNADIWTDFPFAKLRREPEGMAHLVLVPNPSYRGEGDFSLRAGRVNNHPPFALTYTGIGIYRPELFNACGAGAFGLAPLLREAAKSGQLEGERYMGSWRDVGTPDRLRDLDEYLREKKRPEPTL